MNGSCVAILALCGMFALHTEAADELVSSCESMIVSNLSASATREVFNLESNNVSRFVVQILNTPARKGDRLYPEDVIRHLMSVDSAQTMGWLLDNYPNLSSMGRANMAKGLRHNKYKEAFPVLGLLLDDRSVVSNADAFAQAPLSVKPYVHFRVCDYAYESYMYMLDVCGKRTGDLPYHLSLTSSYSDRDQAINVLKKCRTQGESAVLEQRESIEKISPSVSKRVKQFVDHARDK